MLISGTAEDKDVALWHLAIAGFRTSLHFTALMHLCSALLAWMLVPKFSLELETCRVPRYLAPRNFVFGPTLVTKCELKRLHLEYSNRHDCSPIKTVCDCVVRVKVKMALFLISRY